MTAQSHRFQRILWLRRCRAYISLMRLDKPIGIYLVLWPSLWALWLAAKGIPPIKELLIFIAGAIIMRSAGCLINDYADRHLDGQVTRTRNRPLVTGDISPGAALIAFGLLLLMAFGLVLLLNPLCFWVALGALALTGLYPYMKRHTYLPQVVLGAAFAMAIPLAYAAITATLPKEAALLYIAVLLWTISYDTFYAMVDRDDDLVAGIKSTAILFGDQDRTAIALLQGSMVVCLVILGLQAHLGASYYLGLAGAGLLFAYQHWLTRTRAKAACFSAFTNNHWVGLLIWLGIAAQFPWWPAA
jgi:4-hydroxybenzoate polyprenyltransferase